MLGVRAAKSCNNIGYKVCRLHELRSSVARRSGVLDWPQERTGEHRPGTSLFHEWAFEEIRFTSGGFQKRNQTLLGVRHAFLPHVGGSQRSALVQPIGQRI